LFRSEWIFIYVHSGVSATNKGALIRFKEVYMEMNE